MSSPGRWMPGTDPYERLTPFQKVAVLVDLLAAEKSKRGEKDPYLIADLTTEEAFWRRRATLMDPFWDVTHNLHVVREDSASVLYIPRPAQEQLHAEVEKDQLKQQPTWLLIPKPRKLGISEAATKILYSRWRNRENHSIMAMAQKGPEGEKIFRKFHHTWETDLLKPLLKKGSVRQMETLLGKSIIEMRTAGAAMQKRQGVGRGDTVQDFFGTEVAFWPTAAIAMMMGILNSMPRWPYWDTIRFLETTGFGRQGYMWDKCQEAMEHPESTSWRILFLNWLELHDCYLPLSSLDEGRRMRDQILGKGGNEKERFLLEQKGATLEQIKFRREKIKEQEGKTLKEKTRAFEQEYPLDIYDAFQAVGANTFDADALTMQMRRTGRARWRGDLISPHQLWTRRTNSGIVPVTPMPSFSGEKHYQDEGALEVWNMPIPRHRYLVFVDPSHGLAIGDPAVMVVYDRDANKQVAVWSQHKTDVEDLLDPCRLLSKWYNDALIIVEVNLGRLLIKWLRLCDRRGHLYRSRDESLIKQDTDPAEQYGYNISHLTKPIIVGVLRDVLRRTPEVIQDPETLKEMQNFRQELNAQGTAIVYPGAKEGSGRHDDRVIGLGGCIAVHLMQPLSGPAPPPEAPSKVVMADRWNVKGYGKSKRKGAVHPELGKNW